jgi:hypothetical protein
MNEQTALMAQTEQTESQTEQKPTTVADAVSVSLSLPTAADKAAEAMESGKAAAEAEAQKQADDVQRILEATATITAELRNVVTAAKRLRGEMARVLYDAWRLAGPGNSRQFKAILDSCEKSVIASEKVERWTDLGPEARSYQTYKTHFVRYIEVLKASAPGPTKTRNEDGTETENPVDPLAIQSMISKWYLNQNRDVQTGKPNGQTPTGRDGNKGATAGKSDKDAPEAAPVVVVGKDEETGEDVGLVVGMTRVTVPVKGEDGKYAHESVSLMQPVQQELSRLLQQIGKAVFDGVPPDRIIQSLQMAYADLGEAIPGIKVRKVALPKPNAQTAAAVAKAKAGK